MAMTAVLTQSQEAIAQQPCNFVLRVLNSSAVDVVNVENISITVRGPDGKPTLGTNIGTIAVAPGISVPQVGGSQFNVPVPVSSSMYFSFSIAFPSQGVGGTAAQSLGQFQVFCEVFTSDDAVFISPPLSVDVNMPLFGQPTGSPPNPATSIGSLQFMDPRNTSLAL